MVLAYSTVAETVLHLTLPGVIVWVGGHIVSSLMTPGLADLAKTLRVLKSTPDIACIVDELRALNASVLELQEYVAERDILAVPEARVISVS